MPAGRPPSLTPARIAQIAEAFLYGFTDEEAAELVNVDRKTIQRARAGSFCPAIKRAELARKAEYIRRITEGTRPDWARWAWFLERRFPLQFSKPEIQLQVNNNTQVTNNSLIVSAEIAEAMVSRHKVHSSKVDNLFKERKAKNGNGNSSPEAKE